MDTKSDEQFQIIKAIIEANKQEAADKKKNIDEKLTQLT